MKVYSTSCTVTFHRSLNLICDRLYVNKCIVADSIQECASNHVEVGASHSSVHPYIRLPIDDMAVSLSQRWVSVRCGRSRF